MGWSNLAHLGVLAVTPEHLDKQLYVCERTEPGSLGERVDRRIGQRSGPPQLDQLAPQASQRGRLLVQDPPEAAPSTLVLPSRSRFT